MRKSTLVFVFVLSIIIIFGSRLYSRSHYFFSPDGVQYALAMDDFGISKMQPHAPGYVFYVFAGKLTRSIVKDANLALVVVNIVLSTLTCVLIFAFAYHSSTDDKSIRAWTAWLLLVPNVMFWFFGSISDIYAAELFGTLLVAYCCYRSIQGSKKYFYIAPLSLALLGSIKLTAMVFLFPLALYTIVKSPYKPKFLPILIFSISFLAWFTPLILSEGFDSYFSLIWGAFASYEGTASENVSSLRELIRNARDVAYYMTLGAGLLNVLLIGILAVLGYRPAWIRRDQLVFGLLWLGPYVIFLVFVFIGNIGYLMPTLAACAIFISYYYVRSTSRQVLVLLVLLNFLYSSAHFLIFPRIPAQVVGEGLEFQEKTWKQKFLGQVNLFLYPVHESIRKSDQDMEWIIRKVRSICPSQKPAILITTDTPFANWRKLQYYLPESTVVRLYAKNKFLIAKNRKFESHEGKILQVKENCKTMWFLPSSDERTLLLNPKTLVQDQGNSWRVVYLTQGPIELPFEENVFLKIN